MSYSERQRHCLDAMGLVAWTCTAQAGIPKPPAGLQIPDARLEQGHDTLAVSERTQSAAMPATIEHLGQWLVGQPVSQMSYKGGQTYCMGSDQAPLMVVCVQEDATSQMPLSRESAQIFDMMMRAIDRPRTGYRQCVMPVGAPAQRELDVAAVYIDDLLTAHTGAVLVLDPHLDKGSEAAESEKTALPQSAVPVWRIPHPDLLLATPQLKRRAWQGLKSLKRVLDVG
ncbi:MAG: hypothetical protein AB8B97_22125 [Granulosicoccus sp.]